MAAAAWAMACLPAWAAKPPAATSITPDSLAGRGLGTTVSASGGVFTIDGGSVAGANLFESFSAFSLASGDTARWVYTGGAISPGQIANVINRVTGGAPSQIFGTLDSTALPNANFYFINPAGIVFGAGAQINVPAAAYFSTASEVRFGSGQTAFSASNPGSTLSMAAPASFGFLGGEGDLTIDGVDSGFFQGAGALSLSGANLTIANVAAASPIQAGGVGLFAVGAQSLDLPVTGVTPITQSFSGALTIDNAAVQRTPSTAPDAVVQIRAGTATLSGASVISTLDERGDSGSRGDITIGAQSLTLTGSTVSSDTATSAAGGYVTIAADTVALASGSSISALTCGAACYGQGVGGAVTLQGRSAANSLALTIDATSAISTNTSGPGSAGVIGITASSVVNAGSISSASLLPDAGPAGVINIGGGGDPGALAGSLRNTGVIDTDTAGAYRAGDITISMNAIVNTGLITSSAGSTSTAPSGDIQLNVASLKVLAGGAVATDSANAAAAGSVNIFVQPEAASLTGPAIVIDGSDGLGHVSEITSRNTYAGSCGATPYCGDAGTVGINADFSVDPPRPLPTAAAGLTVSNGGTITTDSLRGSAGDIAINLARGSLLTVAGAQNVGVITTSSISNTPGMIYLIGGSAIVLNGAEIAGLGPYPSSRSFVIIRSPASILSTDRPNTIKTTGVLELNSPLVDLSGATTLANLSFIDAGSVLSGQCGSLQASGETSEFLNPLQGPYGSVLAPPSGGETDHDAPHSSGCGRGSLPRGQPVDRRPG